MSSPTARRRRDGTAPQLTLGPLLDEVLSGDTAPKIPTRSSPGRLPRPNSEPNSTALHPGTSLRGTDPSAGEQLLLTIEETAAKLHIGRRQAFELVWRGELPVVRLGPRTIRVAYPVLEEFVLSRSRPY